MKLLDNICQQVLSEEVSDDTGLLNGKLGKAIFLFEYAKSCNVPIAEEQAYELLQEVLDNLSEGQSEKNLGLTNGLFGIGCGIHYLYANGFLDIEDPDDFFSAFDFLAVKIANNYPPIALGYEGLAAVALYMLKRISHDKHNGSSIGLLKEHFIYLIDRLHELQLTTSSQGEQVLALLLEISKRGYYKTRVEAMIKHLMDKRTVVMPFPKIQGYAGVGLQILNKTVL